MIKIGIIVGGTRSTRKTEDVAKWVFAAASKRTDATFELVDLKDYHLPVFDEPGLPSMGQLSHPHTKKWAEAIEKFDGFVFVTAEYNHGIPGVLKNAIDFIYTPWNNKAAGFVSYGSAGGVRAVEQLRQVMGELQVADVRAQVMLSLFEDWEGFTKFKPRDRWNDPLKAVLDQVVAWSGALKPLRTK